MILDNIVVEIILIISAISTVLLVLEASGLSPTISKHMAKNRLSTTIEVLNELGLDINEKKDIIDKCVKQSSLKRIEQKLEKLSINESVEIGKSQNGYIFPKYIDLMGATTFHRNAKDFARELNTYYKHTLINKIDFDFVVTSKLGSPILGYEFAYFIDKPFVLHSEEEKFRIEDNENDPRSKFDFGCLDYKQAKSALIVDDSTTGGRKVVEIIKDLRKFGFIVNDCLVVFAPKGKDAKGRLEDESVKLHYIIETPIIKENV